MEYILSFYAIVTLLISWLSLREASKEKDLWEATQMLDFGLMLAIFWPWYLIKGIFNKIKQLRQGE